MAPRRRRVPHPGAPMSAPVWLPLFPLQTVLFPGGVLPLRIFEARYMDMATRCLRDDSPFGVCLIAEGAEVGRPARPHPVGVSARITGWDMNQPGLLHVVAVGEQRFRIRRTEVGENGLLLGEIEWLDEPAACAVGPQHQRLVALLEAIIEDAGEAHFPPPHRLDDAAWVGMRLASVLPLTLEVRQKLLELDDPRGSLDLIRVFLQREGLVDD